MRILLSYASQFDKGEGIHIERVLRRMGHDVVALNVAAHTRKGDAPGKLVRGFPAGAHLTDLLAKVGGADLFLYVEPLGLLPRGLEHSPIPTACIISDVHRNLPARIRLASLFDHVFLYQKHYMHAFDQHPSDALHWFPWSCDTEVTRDLGVKRDLDVALIGQLFPPRKRALDAIAKKHSVNEIRYYKQEEIPGVYSRARIVLNIPLEDDLNQRFFEALSCGALLITRREANGQAELYREGEQFVAYTDHDDLIAKVDHFLAHEDERARIAAAGQAETLARHTLAHRLEGLVATMEKGVRESAPARRATSAIVAKTYAHCYERMGHVDAILSMAAETPRGAHRGQLLAIVLKGVARRALLRW